MNPAENYILKQQEPFKSILIELQILIENSTPALDMKFKWGIPFYYLKNQPFCYLNVSKNYVDLGIVKGAENQIYLNKLVSKNRKKMVSLRYYKLEDIDVEVLVSVIQKAAELY